MEFNDLINEMADELSGGKKGLFGKKADVGRCLNILDRMASALPEVVNEARYILKQKQDIINGAQNLAKQTVTEAEIRAEQIISESELLKRAQTEAAQLMQTAQMQADTLIHKTKEHLEVMFQDIEQFLLNNLAMIRNNREELRECLKK